MENYTLSGKTAADDLFLPVGRLVTAWPVLFRKTITIYSSLDLVDVRYRVSNTLRYRVPGQPVVDRQNVEFGSGVAIVPEGELWDNYFNKPGIQACGENVNEWTHHHPDGSSRVFDSLLPGKWDFVAYCYVASSLAQAGDTMQVHMAASYLNLIVFREARSFSPG